LKATRSEVRESKALPLDDFTWIHPHRLTKYWTIECERVKLTVLAARVDAGRKFLQELSIEQPSGKAGAQLSRVDTSQVGAEPGGDHRPGELSSIELPQREKRFNAGPGQLGLAVAADVFKKKVAKRDVPNAIPVGLRQRCRHRVFVGGVGARPREQNFDQPKAKRISLPFEQLFPNGVHGNPLMRAVYRGKQRHNFEFSLSAQGMKRPSTILTTAPRQPNWGASQNCLS
jgi:hypothetical protein